MPLALLRPSIMRAKLPWIGPSILPSNPWLFVQVHPPEEVTCRSEREEPPEAGGLSRDDVEAIWDSVVGLYQTGLQPAMSLCVRRHGRVVLDRSIGHMSGNSPSDPPDAPKVLARPDSLFSLYSASKAITAMVVHLLDDRGLIHLDDPIEEYIPEFGRNGKEWITLRHVLTHRAGIPSVPGARVDVELVADPKRVVRLLCDVRPTAPAGRRLEYHALTGGYIIGEVIERVTGKDLRTVLREEILEPLGFKHLNYGVAPDEVDLVAKNAFTGPPPLPPYSWMLGKSLGVDLRAAVTLSNEPEFLTSIIPSGNIVGTANEASRFFELLLNHGELDGVRIFDRRTIRRAIAEQSYLEVDSILGAPVRYGMGFMLGAKWFSLYGHDTPHAFGHIGFTSVVVWADPDRDISVGLMTSGKPFLTLGQVRWLQIARTIARRCPKGPQRQARR